jgi:hypothetical protein
MELDTETLPFYVHARLRGRLNMALMPRTLARVVAACAAAERVAVLLDASELEGSLSTMDRYRLSVDLADRARDFALAQGGRQLRIATLANPSLIDPRRFGENVAVNRGADVRVFTGAGEAIAWLREYFPSP